MRASEDALDTLAYYELAERYAAAHNIPADEVLTSISERIMNEGERPALVAPDDNAPICVDTGSEAERSVKAAVVAASVASAASGIAHSSCHRMRSDDSPGFDRFTERILSCILSYFPSRIKASKVCKSWRDVLTRMQRSKHIQTLAARADLQPELAVKIESALYSRCEGSINQYYREKLKQLLNNLRVSRNAELCANVLSGQIAPDTLVGMSSHELASKELMSLKAKWRQESLDDARKTLQLMNVTDHFECPICGHRNAQYQFWRRKTIVDRCKLLVKCLECSHKWEP